MARDIPFVLVTSHDAEVISRAYAQAPLPKSRSI